MGSKPSNDHDVKVHRDRNWSSGLRFKSLLVSKYSQVAEWVDAKLIVTGKIGTTVGILEDVGH